MNFKSEFLNEINERGFIYQHIDIEDLDNLMSKNKISGYIGFDITSDSLHVGSLIQLMLLHWLDFYGHQSIALIGGGTTLIGDPSGKDQTRKILSKKEIDKNISNIELTFSRFINLQNNSLIINNYDWLSNLNYIDFLREFGSRITLNKMLTFDSVKSRLDREQPLTILEFNYMLLQAYDFYYLNKNHNCVLQMGGSDQWGNILSGVDLIRKINKKEAFGITSPLITNSDGSKMGKTADGAVWLNKEKISSLDFFQFWRNVNDKDVSKFLYLFTKLPLNEIKKLSLLKNQEINEAKKILAYEVTKIVRGTEDADEALEIADNTFNSKIIDQRLPNISHNESDIKNNNFTILDAIEKLKLANSRSEVKRLIKSDGIKVNDKLYKNSDLSLKEYSALKEIKIAVGKKKIGILKII
ncbi:MAG: tyrosine--tRNA ligase [Candidatus Pelagibacterales bacterium]|nr:MAG: tyrosine--tRNA ligase [Pelagibacterales bacterium]